MSCQPCDDIGAGELACGLRPYGSVGSVRTPWQMVPREVTVPNLLEGGQSVAIAEDSRRHDVLLMMSGPIA